jgi:AcrR family transcriptional regulator
MNMARHSNDHVNNRQKILDVATKLVMERGVKGTSLADIAREAQISKGTLFYHFAAKDDLIYELTEQHFDRITRSLLQRVEQMHGNRWKRSLARSGGNI